MERSDRLAEKLCSVYVHLRAYYAVLIIVDLPSDPDAHVRIDKKRSLQEKICEKHGERKRKQR